jgi:hypothetical protein
MSGVDLARIVGGWATLITCIMVAFGSLFALYQLRIAAKARRLQVLVSIYDHLRPQEIVETEQQLIHDSSGQINADNLTENEIRKVNNLIYSYQRLGYFLYQGLVSEKELVPMVGWESIVLWAKLKSYIYKQLRADVPHARAHFEYLAATSRKYMSKHLETGTLGITNFDPEKFRNLDS